MTKEELERLTQLPVTEMDDAESIKITLTFTHTIKKEILDELEPQEFVEQFLICTNDGLLKAYKEIINRIGQ